MRRCRLVQVGRLLRSIVGTLPCLASLARPLADLCLAVNLPAHAKQRAADTDASSTGERVTQAQRPAECAVRGLTTCNRCSLTAMLPLSSIAACTMAQVMSLDFVVSMTTTANPIGSNRHGAAASMQEAGRWGPHFLRRLYDRALVSPTPPPPLPSCATAAAGRLSASASLTLSCTVFTARASPRPPPRPLCSAVDAVVACESQSEFTHRSWDLGSGGTRCHHPPAHTLNPASALPQCIVATFELGNIQALFLSGPTVRTTFRSMAEYWLPTLADALTSVIRNDGRNKLRHDSTRGPGWNGRCGC